MTNWASEMGNRNIDITHWNFRFDFSSRRGGWCVVGQEGTPVSAIMEKTLKVCPQIKPGENYDFYIIPGGVHDMKAWQLHLYHALQIFFEEK